jgi:diguanylate cyclase (GGDEF)-like protein/PAS domain S-box-containing protein
MTYAGIASAVPAKGAHINNVASAIVVAACLFLPPVLYGTVSYSNLKNDMTGDARVAAEVIEQAIIEAPQFWMNEPVLLQNMVHEHIHVLDDPTAEQLAVLDSGGKAIATIGTSPKSPSIVRSVPFHIADRTAGSIAIQRSLRPIIINTGLLALFGLLLAIASFVTLRVIPLREAQRSGETLRQREAALAFANTTLNAATEGALDAMLIIDQNARIVSYNEHFIDLFAVPRAMVEAMDDKPVLELVKSRMRDPEAFVARVKYLYAHPELESREQIETTDGRILDRYSKTLHGPNKKYLGRIWFFRDITERERAAEALKQSEERFKTIFDKARDGIALADAKTKKVLTGNSSFCRMTGYTREELPNMDIGAFHPAEALPGIVRGFEAQVRGESDYASDMPVKRKDGTVFFVDLGAALITLQGRQYIMGIFRDITERKTAMQELQQREALLHAAAFSAAELLTAPSLDEAIRKSLEIVSKTVEVDRIVVLERPARTTDTTGLRYLWESPTNPVKLDKAVVENLAFGTGDILAWKAPLFEGKAVTTDAKTAEGDVAKLFSQLGIKQNLVVPVMVDGKFWGQISFDSCKQERAWAEYEIDILRTLAELIGSAIQRDRYVKEISNANQIVQNTPTILYRLRGVPSLPMIYVSQNIKLFGYEPAVLIESPNLYQSLIHPEDLAAVREKQALSLEPDHPRGTFEFRLLTADGVYRWVETRYTQIRDAAGRLVEVEGLLIDITKRKQAEEKIAQLARTDPLTGLANRSTFIERLQQSFVGARRGAPSFALLYIDLDRFKDINDTLGHPVGDRFLIETSERLKRCIREADLIGRLGGDEFAVLQADVRDNTDAGNLAGKIRAALAEPMQIGGNLLHITTSIGIALYEADTQTPDDLLAQADIALYRAKEEGRDQYRFHTEELDTQVREQVALSEQLHMALSRNEFRLHYQPQIELSTGKIVGMEALLRWEHPSRGLLYPSAFMAVAERTGAIKSIGQWVLDHACEQMHAWGAEGCAPPMLTVNISAVEMKPGDELVAFVQATLKKWDLTPKMLELDVTESMLARATLSQNDVLERLQKLGVKISIDDFGTKYSSLDYLKTYRVNRLKIPPALTRTAAHDPNSAAMVRAIVSIARELNIEVMAQGVETESQWSFLTATSPVKKVQGYYYSKPISPKRAEELLRRGHILPPLAVAESAG